MSTTGAASIGDSPMLELVAWAFFLALAPGAVAVAWVALKRCLHALLGGDAIFRPPEKWAGKKSHRSGTLDDHEARDRPAYAAYRPWER